MPGGKNALLRFPFMDKLIVVGVPNVGKYRLATHAEMISMNYGAPYPWGFMPENTAPSRMWQEKRIGFGGLVHTAWFVLENGERVGAAPNVPETGPGAQRHYLHTSGGIDSSCQLNDNEGYAVVWEGVPSINDKMYRIIHAHVGKHVTADRGGVTISPVTEKDDRIFVGFIGRCLSCPNPERISINALKNACPGLHIELHPDWKNWEIAQAGGEMKIAV